MHIHPEIRQALARERERDAIAAAERTRLLARGGRRERDARPDPARETRGLAAGREITIRPAVAADRPTLADLAVLDSARPLEGDLLVAEVEGELWAACSLADGRTIGDSFRPTQAARALLALRREQIAAAQRGSVRRRRQRLRALRQLLLGS